jgi:hypothetical protein
VRREIKALAEFCAALACVFLVALPDCAWAGKSRGGGGHGGAAHSGSRHHHHYRGYGGLFIGGGFAYGWPYSYGLYPFWESVEQSWPLLYIEQFPGSPTPETQGWIHCPANDASYPEVTDCPGGWQRIIPYAKTPEPPSAP